MTTTGKQPKAVHGDESISAYGPARSTVKGTPLSKDELRRIDAYWQGQPLPVPGDVVPQGQPFAPGAAPNWNI